MLAIRRLRKRLISTINAGVYIEPYGCQMNMNDAEVVLGILENYKSNLTDGFNESYYKFCRSDLENADVALLVTCAIREHAENKIWIRINELSKIRTKSKQKLTIGVLGCMAERLKEKFLEKEGKVDIVCGPDAYRDLPKLIESVMLDGGSALNVALSLEETYADVRPVRLNQSSKSAFVSIMRGCNNMCAYCIVPFTRGRERSRSITTIINEIEDLKNQGVKEITLLGQNVNSYNSVNDESILQYNTELSNGFSSISRSRDEGMKFAELLDLTSLKFPEIRFRFTSPHPKDFPDALLHVIRDRPNICKQIHLPAQSGSSRILERMRRGYSREAYLNLVAHIRLIIPDVSLSSDFITGFCGETQEDHQESLDLIKQVDYDMAYIYAFSMREKTMAHRRYFDDVDQKTKSRRLREMLDLFYELAKIRTKSYVGTDQLVYVEGPSKKDSDVLSGRADNNKTVLFESRADLVPSIGDFVHVNINGSIGLSLKGEIHAISSVSEFQKLKYLSLPSSQHQDQ